MKLAQILKVIPLLLGSINAYGIEALDFDIAALNSNTSEENSAELPFKFNQKLELNHHIRTNSLHRDLAKSEVKFIPEIKIDKNSTTRFQLGIDARYFSYANDLDELKIQLDDTFIKHQLTDETTLIFGRQTIAWGLSDFFHHIQITDLTNPRDLSEPGLTDLEEARLPVFSTRLLGSIADKQVELFVAHEIRPHRFDNRSGDYSVYNTLEEAGLNIDYVDDYEIVDIGDWLIRLSDETAGFDYSLIAGQVYDDNPVLTLNFSPPEIDSISTPHIQLSETLSKSTAIGFSFAKSNDQTVIKSECLYLEDKTYLRNDFLPPTLGSATPSTFEKKSSVQTMLGLDYFGWDNIVITAELANEHIVDHKQFLQQEKNQSNLSLLAQWTPPHSDLSVNAIYVQTFNKESNLFRLEASYQYAGDFSIKFGGISYDSNEEGSVYFNFIQQDRIYLSLNWKS